MTKKVFFILTLFLILTKANAQCDGIGTIVVSEIYFDTRWSEDKSEKYHHFGEYIELYNSSDQTVNLLNWVIKDNHTQYKFLVDNFNSTTNFEIGPGKTKIIAYNGVHTDIYGNTISGKDKFIELFPSASGLEADIILQKSMVLYNDVDKISLFNDKGRLIDEVSYLNGSTTRQNPLTYMGINAYTFHISPKLDNGNGGVFNDPIDPAYIKAIYRSDPASYYSNHVSIIFAVQDATPFTMPFSVPTFPVDPFIYSSPNSNDNFNRTESVAYDIMTGSPVGQSRHYFDELGRPTVSLTRDFKENVIWGTQTTYDNFGRKFRESFPTPTCLGLKKIDFLTDIYYAPIFLYNYYSDNNTQNPYQATAEFPFTETNYDALNPGKVINTYGGNKIANDWKTGYSFTVPASQELYYAYGYDYFDGPIDATTGDKQITTKFYKTVTVDANGVENVAFTDGEGKTLATAKSGDAAFADYQVYSLIGIQGYVDVHIPKNTSTGTLLGLASDYTIYDLKDGQVVTQLLPGSVYRVVANNAPSSNPVMALSNTAITPPVGALGVSYEVNYSDYALNLYNKTGQLLKSVQPNAFHAVYPNSIAITNAPAYITGSGFSSSFTYDSLGQLIDSANSDEGQSKFAYRKDGQIRYSQNVMQAAANKVSYTNHDSHARAIESGVITGTTGIWNDALANVDTNTSIGTSRTEQIFTIYDYPENNSGLSYHLPTNYELNSIVAADIQYNINDYIQHNLSGNVAITYNKVGNYPTAITWYSYDIYGRVEWLAQFNEVIGLKTIHYQYDYKGNVSEVIFQKDVPEEYFAHRYTYDINDKLEKVEVATSYIPYSTQAEYKYYISGELQRLEIGNGLQGLDYVYTLGGMIKSINNPKLDGAYGPFFNGNSDNNDLFGMTIDYYDGDYLRSNTNIPGTSTTGSDYVGNIKAIHWANKQMDALNPSQTVGGTNPATQNLYTYTYDRNNWLNNAQYSAVTNTGTTINDDRYREGDLRYDANGNIVKLVRKNDANVLVDDFDYNYVNAGKNQLTHVDDSVGDAVESGDIDDQQANNYEYNDLGQLKRDAKEDLYYFYNTAGLVTAIWKGTTAPIVKFYYNERGQRIKKERLSLTNPNSVISTDFYVMDFDGNIVSVYNRPLSTLLVDQVETPIYGADRLGVYFKGPNHPQGIIQYEIKDHLGNVRAVVARNPTTNAEEEISFADYYPFGEQLPGRNSTAGYRFAFQGQELDPETGKEAFQLRLWEGRLGRWLTTDPMRQYASPYLGMGNNPMKNIDPTGGTSESTGVRLNSDGTYTVVNGKPDGNSGVYLVDHKGNYDVNSSVRIGTSLTDRSFLDHLDNPMKGAIIDTKSKEGQVFIDKLINLNPELHSYMFNARNFGKYDFKSIGASESWTEPAKIKHYYRGSVLNTGEIVSARDVGNFMAGYIAARAGLTWKEARAGFDTYQGWRDNGITTPIMTILPVPEPLNTTKAQGFGYARAVQRYYKK